MKIGLHVPYWPLGSTANGIVTYASQLVPALRRLGHEVFVLTPHKAPDDNDPHTIDLRNFSSISNLWYRLMFKVAPETASFNVISSAVATAIRELVEKQGLDIFEMEESFGWSFITSRLNLLPLVVRLHGPWFLNGQFEDSGDWIALNRRRIQWEGRAIRGAHFVTSPSATVLNAVQEHYHFDLNASRVVPNPLDAISEELKWDARTCDNDRLLFVGRFDTLKGGDIVVRAFALLAKSYPQLRLTFIGVDKGVKAADGSVLSYEYFIRRNVPEQYWSRIEFHGEISHERVMSLRTQHFVTIIASRAENLSYALLEAMSLGCPIITTAVGGNPELIKEGRNGLLVASQDVNAMAAACERLLNDRTLAATLGRQAWQDCRDLYGSEAIAKRTTAAYREAIGIFNSGSSRN